MSALLKEQLEDSLLFEATATAIRLSKSERDLNTCARLIDTPAVAALPLHVRVSLGNLYLQRLVDITGGLA